MSKVKLCEGVLVLLSFLFQTSPEGLRVDRVVHGEGLFQALVVRSAFPVKAFACASLNIVCTDVDEGDLKLPALCLSCLVQSLLKDLLLILVFVTTEGVVTVRSDVLCPPIAFEGSPCHSACCGKFLRKSTYDSGA